MIGPKKAQTSLSTRVVQSILSQPLRERLIGRPDPVEERTRQEQRTMMQLNNGEWLALAGNTPDPTIYRPGYDGAFFRLVGAVTSGRITERWCRVVR